MLFGRKKKAAAAEESEGSSDVVLGAEDTAEAEGTTTPTGENPRAEERATAGLSGPRDISDVDVSSGYLDFGALRLPMVKDQKVRLDIDQKTRRVIALTISLGQASIQVQPFSAPKSGGTWDDVRTQIEESVVKQKGKVKHVEGRFGTELAARVPTTLKDGRQGWRVARFIGFEGPRWFIRGVVGGRGAIDPEAARAVEDLFAGIVVDRGEDPLPPRELLPLRAPEGARRVVVPRNPAARRTQGQGPNPAAASVADPDPGQ